MINKTQIFEKNRSKSSQKSPELKSPEIKIGMLSKKETNIPQDLNMSSLQVSKKRLSRASSNVNGQKSNKKL